MKNRCQNQRFLMAQNHVWRYTLRLFYTFAIFEKSQKINAKRVTKSRVFWSKNRPSTPKSPLILSFGQLFEDAKNHRFFDASLVVQKIGKISLSGNIKPIQGKRLDPQVSIFGNQCPREPPVSRAQANRKRAKGKKETRNRKQAQKGI